MVKVNLKELQIINDRALHPGENEVSEGVAAELQRRGVLAPLAELDTPPVEEGPILELDPALAVPIDETPQASPAATPASTLPGEFSHDVHLSEADSQ